MATITRGKVSAEMTRCMNAPQTNALAGAALAAGDVVYLKAADGMLYPCDGTAADEKAEFWGICPKAYALGESATALGITAKLQYDDGGSLTVGAKYFVSATPGRLDDAATTGGLRVVARATSVYDIEIIGSR